MKKLISLILCLLLCFTFIVSCENEEAPSSSSNDGERPLVTETSIDHYYHLSLVMQKPNVGNDITVISTTAELENLFEELGLDVQKVYKEIDKKIFETHLILLATSDSREYLMGYRDFRKTTEGYSITADRYSEYSDRYIRPDGTIYYPIEEAVPESEDVYTAKSAIYANVIVIPKSELNETIDTSKEIFLETVKYMIPYRGI